MQQWPVSSCESLEIIKEATQLQQELQSKFELLGAILNKRATGRLRHRGAVQLHKESRDVENASAKDLALNREEDEVDACQALEQRASITHRKGDFQTTVMQCWQGIQSVQLHSRANTPEKWTGVHAEPAGPRWGRCCVGSRANKTYLSVSRPACTPRVKDVNGDNFEHDDGELGGILAKIRSPEGPELDQQALQGAMPVTRSLSGEVSSVAPGWSKPSEEPSCVLHDAGDCSGERKYSQKCHCSHEKCSLPRLHLTGWNPISNTVSIDDTVAKLPVRDGSTVGTVSLNDEKTVTPVHAQPAKHIHAYRTSLNGSINGVERPQGSTKKEEGCSRGDAITVCRQQVYPSSTASLGIQQAVVSCCYQQMRPLQVGVFGPQPSAESMKRICRGRLPQWLQQLPLQQLAMQHLTLQQQMWHLPTYVSQAPTHYRSAQTSWIPVVPPTLRAWGLRAPFIPVEELFPVQMRSSLRGSSMSESGPILLAPRLCQQPECSLA